MIVLTISCLAIFVLKNIEANRSWQNFFADIKVAKNINNSEAWKYGNPALFPKNQLGEPVSISNYERASWALEAIELIGQHPLGYGTVFASFGHLTKAKWPDTTLTQSHSGWLDLTLGIGIPGALLFLIGALLAIHNALKLPLPAGVFGAYFLGAIVLLYITTEASQKIYVDTFLWLIALVSALALPYGKNTPSLDNLRAHEAS
jgi:hypothetical protein